VKSEGSIPLRRHWQQIVKLDISVPSQNLLHVSRVAHIKHKCGRTRLTAGLCCFQRLVNTPLNDCLFDIPAFDYNPSGMIAKGTFPPLGNQFRASVISKGDTEKCMVGGRERHTPDAQVIIMGG
jgi:hypothetical protein